MCLNPLWINKQRMHVPCGKCVECIVNKSKEWAFRITLESKLYDKNCMITLTYNENNLATPSLERRDVQLFLKRLRKKINNDKIRYFGCGEYGSLHGRKHWHIIIFNYDFPDKYFFCTDNKGTKLYRSKTLEDLWTFGFSSIGEVNFDSAKYCAIYLQKKELGDRKRPFVFMSLKPGIGADCVTLDWLLSDRIYHNGKYIKIPRYFLAVLERKYNISLDWLREKRKDKSKKIFSELPFYEQEKFLDIRIKRFKKLLKKIGKSGKIT